MQAYNAFLTLQADGIVDGTLTRVLLDYGSIQYANEAGNVLKDYVVRSLRRDTSLSQIKTHELRIPSGSEILWSLTMLRRRASGAGIFRMEAARRHQQTIAYEIMSGDRAIIERLFLPEARRMDLQLSDVSTAS